MAQSPQAMPPSNAATIAVLRSLWNLRIVMKSGFTKKEG